MLNKLLIIGLTFFLFSCKEKSISEHSFFYWRSKFNLSITEKKHLDKNQVSVLYTRFFDVDIDKKSKMPIPIGIIDSLEAVPKNISIIPVIFITNRTFLNINEGQAKELAINVFRKINSLDSMYTELQIDCDWSQGTKKIYFLFLIELKKLISKKTKLSCTIRLHQVKYPNITGVPPVDRGMLMYYNMGNLNDINGINSIYNFETSKKYVAYVSNYSLSLDVALPMFNWIVKFRNNKVVQLISKKQLPDLSNQLYFQKQEKNLYKVKSSEIIKGVYYKEGDVLKIESINDSLLLLAAKQLNTYLNSEKRKIVLYDLDEINLKNYDDKTIQKVFNTFN